MSSDSSGDLQDDLPELDDDNGTDSVDDSGDDSSDDDLTEFENDGHEQYSFTIENGVVVAAFESEDGVMQPESIDSDEQFIVDTNGDVLKIETKLNGQEITRYSDSDGDGLYARVGEQWVSSTTDPASPMPEIASVLSFHGSGSDDIIGLNTSGGAAGGTGADQFVFRELGHVEIEDFDHDEGDKIVIDTGLGFESLSHLAQYVTAITYDGTDTVIEFGEAISITLTGISPSFVSASDFVVLS